MNYSEQIAVAVKHFWQTRLNQGSNQGSVSGKKDAGNRTAVTGGAQLDGFVSLLAMILQDSGLSDHQIYTDKKDLVLPGFFRPAKQWDLVVVADHILLATIEFKSHVGPSFGNNFNNRVEEALGSSTDILSAFREGAFRPSLRPWLGWWLLRTESRNWLPEFCNITQRPCNGLCKNAQGGKIQTRVTAGH